MKLRNKLIDFESWECYNKNQVDKTINFYISYRDNKSLLQLEHAILYKKYETWLKLNKINDTKSNFKNWLFDYLFL